MKFEQFLQAHLNLIPSIFAAAQTFKTIGHSKESTLQKIVQITEGAASLAEAVPVPQVQAIAATVGTIVEGVFGTTQTQPAASQPAPSAAQVVAEHEA